ncbi:uncharacterized protein PGTG_02847, partial [Puccinia graminis f. sp. tritici CRL 75-36-700-3]
MLGHPEYSKFSSQQLVASGCYIPIYYTTPSQYIATQITFNTSLTLTFTSFDYIDYSKQMPRGPNWLSEEDAQLAR